MGLSIIINSFLVSVPVLNTIVIIKLLEKPKIDKNKIFEDAGFKF